MSNYTKTTNFASKDNLSPGNPLKIVKGTEIDTEFNNIQTAVGTKTDNSAAAITGGTIVGITDLAVADGGTGASTATAALNNLLPTQTGNANKYLQTDGTNATWDAVSLSTSDITGTLPVANGGTGVTTSTGTGAVVLSNSPTLVTPALGTPASGTATNLTGLPISTGVSGLGTGVATFLATPSSANLLAALTDETGTGSAVFATSPTLVTPALGTPSSATLTNATGLPISTGVSGLGTGIATFLGTPSSANLLAAVSDETGTGALVFATSPTLVTPALGTPASGVATNLTGLPLSTGVTGTLPVLNGGTGVTTSTGSGNNVLSTSPTLVTPILGTPTSATLTNATGLPLSTGVTGTLPVANGGTGQTSYTDGQLLIGNTTGNTLTKATLTAGSGITVTNSAGGITIAATGGGGSGDVVGPASATDNALVRFDTTTGKLVQNSVGILSDTGAISGLTDISASGAVTLSGGTANGVTYLNGSKVLTSGSALVFDGANLGVGVTPSSWAAGSNAVQNTAGSVWRYGTDNIFVGQNYYFNGTNRIYSITAAATEYRQNLGSHIWYTAASGTAGNAISFTQAMTLDASGNLGVGTTSPINNSGYGGFSLNGTSGALLSMMTGGTESSRIASISNETSLQCKASTGYITFVQGVSGGTERARIDTSGNLLVGGTSSVIGKLEVSVTDTSAIADGINIRGTQNNAYGGYLSWSDTWNGDSYRGKIAAILGYREDVGKGQLRFFTYGSSALTERARFLSGGQLLVGSTTNVVNAGTTQLYVKTTGGDYVGYFETTNTSPYGDYIKYSGAAPNSTGFEFLVCSDTSATRIQLRSNGGIGNYSANNVNLSDRREKTNFAPATSYLDKICAIPVQTFNYIDQNMEDDGGLTLGVVAQDVQAVAPELVTESDWGTKEEPKMRLSIYQTDLQYALMKCIQEQQAIIQQLQADVATLKGN